MTTRLLPWIFGLLAAGFLPWFAGAQGSGALNFDIVATVDDRGITAYDVTMRARLLAFQSGLDPQNAETVEDLRPSALDQLINEAVQLNLAEELGFEPPFEQVQEQLEGIAERNGQPSLDAFGETLQDAGIQLQSLRNLFIAQAIWQIGQGALLSGQIEVTEEDIEAEFVRLRAATGEQEWRIYEIVVPLRGRGNAAAQRQADSLYQQTLDAQDLDFPILAAQVSGVPSAGRNGDLGWVLRRDLSAQSRNALDDVEVGEVTPPFLTERGYTLLLKGGERLAGYSSITDYISVHQLIRILDSGGESAEDQADLRILNGVAQQVDSCERFDEAVERFGEADSGPLGERDERSFPPELLGLLKANPQGTPTSIVPLSATQAAIFVVCDSRRDAVDLTREDVENALFATQRAELASRRLQQLRRQAFIDLRE